MSAQHVATESLPRIALDVCPSTASKRVSRAIYSLDGRGVVLVPPQGIHPKGAMEWLLVPVGTHNVQPY